MNNFPVRAIPVLWAFLVGCSGAQVAFEAPSPGQLPDLESRVAADPTDLQSILLLATGYRETNRASEALDLVKGAQEHHPEESTLVLLEGLFAEETGDFPGARRAFEEFLGSGPPDALRKQAEAHLQLVRTEELKASVRDALAREDELSDTPPDPTSVGVFPFHYQGTDPEWVPLSNALAELLITDLGVTGRLTVLERVKIQTLLRELALAESGYVDRDTAARSGRILGAGHLVQGQFRIDPSMRIGVDAALVKVGEPEESDVEPVTGQGEIQQLFDLEKEMALDLYAQMGVQLTPAERSRVNERHTENIQALLAFGRGLTAQDQGDLQAAQAHFSQAADLDPGFRIAQAAVRSVAGAASAMAAQASLQLHATAQRLAQRKEAVQALRNAPASIRQRILSRLTIQQRAALAELLGQDRVGTAILMELVFVRPGGTP